MKLGTTLMGSLARVLRDEIGLRHERLIQQIVAVVDWVVGPELQSAEGERDQARNILRECVARLIEGDGGCTLTNREFAQSLCANCEWLNVEVGP